MATYRLFLGIPPDDDTVTNLEMVPDQAMAPNRQTRWTPKPNLHLTLLFLGSVDEELTKRITDICGDSPFKESFLLPFDRYRLVLRKRKPAMVWAQYVLVPPFVKLVHHLHDQCSEIIKLQQLHDPMLPHCTLARIKEGAKKEQFDLSKVPKSSPWLARRYCLYESVLKKSGAEYEILEEFPFTDRQ